MNVDGMGLVSKRLLTDIADAIRKKNGSTDPIAPAKMPETITGMESGLKFAIKIYTDKSLVLICGRNEVVFDVVKDRV